MALLGRIDSRDIAKKLVLQHKSVMRLISRHEEIINCGGSEILYRLEPVTNEEGGRPKKYALLTDGQTKILLALSKNSEEAIQLKASFGKGKAMKGEIF
jgi:phage regulator Rha-like protein